MQERENQGIFSDRRRQKFFEYRGILCSVLFGTNGSLRRKRSGGPGALRIGGDFLEQEGVREIVIPHPTWPNHPAIFNRRRLKVTAIPITIGHAAGRLEAIGTYQGGKRCFAARMLPQPDGRRSTEEEWKKCVGTFSQEEALPLF